MIVRRCCTRDTRALGTMYLKEVERKEVELVHWKHV
jgi:hypothetical protein